MSSLCGSGQFGEAAFQHLQYAGGIVHRQGGLGGVGQGGVAGPLEPFGVLLGLDQADGGGRQLAHGADHLRVARMADQNDVLAGGVVALGLHMDLGHQGAGGVQKQQVAGAGVGGHRLGHAVGGEDDRAVVGAFVQLLDEDGAHGLQPLDHMAVVDDLVAHIDGGAVFLDGPLHDLDRPVHPGAEAARRRQAHGDRTGRGRRRRGRGRSWAGT